MHEAARAAFDRPEQDIDVLDLVFDSLVDTSQGADDDGARHLRFAGHGHVVEVRVRTGDARAESLSVEVRVEPTDVRTLEIRGEAAPVTADVDSEGHACVTGVRPGITTVLLHTVSTGGPRVVRTAWVRL